MLLAGGGGGREGDLPRARPPARHARPAPGVQGRDRRPVRRRVRRGRDPESLHELQRRVPVRRAARVRRARGRRERLDGALRPHRRPGGTAPRRPGGGRGKGPVLHARDGRSRRSSGACASRWESSRSARPGRRLPGPVWRRRRGGRARRRASWPAATTGRSSSARVSRAARARSWTRAAACSDATTGSGGSRRVSAAGSASQPAVPCTSSARSRRPTPSSWGRERSLRHTASRRRVGCTPAASRVQAKLRHRASPVPASVVASNGGFSLALEEPAYAVATGQVAALYDGDAVVGAGVVTRVHRDAVH